MIIAGGYCGYGPDYCGKGCVSNCDAGAECGQFANPKNKTCPMNTWYIYIRIPMGILHNVVLIIIIIYTSCSQYGFCGTTKGMSISLPHTLLIPN